MTRSLRTAVLGLSLLFPGAALAETSPDGVFRDVDETRLGSGPRQIVPLRYRTFTADLASLERVLAQAPVDRGGPVSKVLVMYLPLPYGGFGSFFVEESRSRSPRSSQRSRPIGARGSTTRPPPRGWT